MENVRTPTKLGRKARRTWLAMIDEYDLGPHELRILEDACREIDLIDRMEAELQDPDFELVVRGSMGQPVSSPIVQEIRQHRAVIARLFQALKLPEAEGDTGEASASASARDLANKRWGRGA